MKILVPLDGSELALTALAVATGLAREQAAELLLLTVGEVPATSADEPRALASLTRVLDEAAARVEGVTVETRIEFADDPAATIERVAEEEAIDLIVMTPREFEGSSPSDGSVTEAIPPVAVVPAVSGPGGRPEVNETSPDVPEVTTSKATEREAAPAVVTPAEASTEVAGEVNRSATVAWYLAWRRRFAQPRSQADDATASTPATTAQSAPAPVGLRLRLLGAFGLSHGGESVVLNRGTRRLLAFVALQGQCVSRDVVAEALWPEASTDSSHARLRSAIWRLEPVARAAMMINASEFELSPAVDVDFADAKALAHRILREDIPYTEEDTQLAAVAALASDLLPEWDDDWAIAEAEEWRQLRLRALESLAQKLLEAGRYADALETVSEAKRVDPLRQSPRALIVGIHLAEGNQSDAVREFLAYRELLQEELGISPTPHLLDLMRGLS